MPFLPVKDRSSIMPFEGASDLEFRLARSFALIVDWSVALQGRHSLRDVITILARQTKAQNVALYRYKFASGERRMIAAHSEKHDGTPPDLPSGNFLRFLLKFRNDDLDDATVWRLNEKRTDPNFAGSEAEREWLARPDIANVSLIVLQRSEMHIDIMELSFTAIPEFNEKLHPILVVQALSQAWCARRAGLVSQMIAQFTRHGPQEGASHVKDVLGGGNPYGLTRSELAVCNELARGAAPKLIAQSLGVSIATIRSQLSSIYAKTETDGQKSLTALLYHSSNPRSEGAM
jgi:DNA-binding CsgD family transcriptional regulator